MGIFSFAVEAHPWDEFVLYRYLVREKVGNAELKFTAIQDGGKRLESKRNITIQKGHLPFIVSSPVMGQTYLFGVPMQLNASPSDPENKIEVKYNQKVVATLTKPNFSGTWVPRQEGANQLEFSEINGDGAVVNRKYVDFIVSAALEQITADNLVAGTTAIVTGKEQTLEAVTSDKVKSVDFLIDGVSVGKDSTPPYSVKWTPTKTEEMASYIYTINVETLSPFVSVKTHPLFLYPVNEKGKQFCSKIATNWNPNTVYQDKQYVIYKSDFFHSQGMSQGIEPDSLNGWQNWSRVPCTVILFNETIPDFHQVDRLKSYEPNKQYTIKGLIKYPESLGGETKVTNLKVEQKNKLVADRVPVDADGNFSFDFVYRGDEICFYGNRCANLFVEATNDLGKKHSINMQLLTEKNK